ncbi:MAG: hypothetical protein UV17_C0019G0035 [Candidatus Gottesmanbacteria bacterium GW2011_GWA1_42_26]|nr:MAG: hypothetical protein UV17_C0019G0035 [Candidatus Gottesmanbacteria bacterium GW2011_GWA1_42_26]
MSGQNAQPGYNRLGTPLGRSNPSVHRAHRSGAKSASKEQLALNDEVVGKDLSQKVILRKRLLTSGRSYLGASESN